MRKSTKRFTKEQIEEIINLYKSENYNCRELAKKYNVWSTSIERLLKRNDIKINTDISTRFQREFIVDENYLDNIDTEEKAYFLGFFFADGYNNQNRNYIKIGLQEEDKEILVKFTKLFSSNYKLVYEEISKRNPKWKNQYALRFTSKKLCNRLAELGAIQNKSLILKFPVENVPEKLIPHFMRGYFDGDGSLSCIGKYKSIEASFVSSHNFCVVAKNIIEKYVDIHCYLKQSKQHKIQTKIIKINGSKQALKFLDWLYRDATIFLNRKYNRYLEYKKLKCKLQN